MPSTRRCEQCGLRMPAHRPRRRDVEGRMLCDGCHPKGRGSESRPVGYHGSHNGRLAVATPDACPSCGFRLGADDQRIGACPNCGFNWKGHVSVTTSTTPFIPVGVGPNSTTTYVPVEWVRTGFRQGIQDFTPTEDVPDDADICPNCGHQAFVYDSDIHDNPFASCYHCGYHERGPFRSARRTASLVGRRVQVMSTREVGEVIEERSGGFGPYLVRFEDGTEREVDPMDVRVWEFDASRKQAQVQWRDLGGRWEADRGEMHAVILPTTAYAWRVTSKVTGEAASGDAPDLEVAKLRAATAMGVTGSRKQAAERPWIGADAWILADANIEPIPHMGPDGNSDGFYWPRAEAEAAIAAGVPIHGSRQRPYEIMDPQNYEVVWAARHGQSARWRIFPRTSSRTAATQVRTTDLRVGQTIDFDAKRGVVPHYEDVPITPESMGERPSGKLTIAAIEPVSYDTHAQTGRAGRAYRITFDNGRSIVATTQVKFPVTSARKVGSQWTDLDGKGYSWEGPSDEDYLLVGGGSHGTPIGYHGVIDGMVVVQSGFATLEEAKAAAQEQVDSFKRGGRKLAHDSGEGKNLYHCPFCGAGQITGRSDGSVECAYCHNVFTVQVQPEFSAMPQTDPETGEPLEMPGMPGQRGEAAPEVPPGEEVVVEEPVEEEAKNPVPPQFLSSRYYLTDDGVALSEEAYQRHLALRFADDRDGVLADIRAQIGAGRG